MQFTIERMNVFTNDDKGIPRRGYAFMDERNRCMLIVYGESYVKKVENLLRNGQ